MPRPEPPNRHHMRQQGATRKDETWTRRMESSRPSGAGGADDPIRLRCLGFCGADDTVEPAALKQISEQHGWVEWGILFRPDKAGSARFASDEWLTRLGQVNSAGRMRLAGHLCATHVDDLLRGDTSFVRKLRDVPPTPKPPTPKPPTPKPLTPNPPRRGGPPAVSSPGLQPCVVTLARGMTAGGLPAAASQRDRRQRCRRDAVRRCGGGGGVRRGATAGETRRALPWSPCTSLHDHAHPCAHPAPTLPLHRRCARCPRSSSSCNATHSPARCGRPSSSRPLLPLPCALA